VDIPTSTMKSFFKGEVCFFCIKYLTNKKYFTCKIFFNGDGEGGDNGEVVVVDEIV